MGMDVAFFKGKKRSFARSGLMMMVGDEFPARCAGLTSICTFGALEVYDPAQTTDQMGTCNGGIGFTYFYFL